MLPDRIYDHSKYDSVVTHALAHKLGSLIESYRTPLHKIKCCAACKLLKWAERTRACTFYIN